MRLMDIEKALDTINRKIEQVSEITTKVTDNQYVKLVGEASKLVNFAVSFNNYIIQRRFEACLKGFSDDKPTEEQLTKLEKFIDSPEKAEFIADSFRKVLLSNSSETSLVMGTIIKSVISEEDSINHEKLISLNALSQFYDADILNFLLLREYVDYERLVITITMEGIPRPATKFNLNKLSDYAKEKGVSKDSLIITLDKSVNLQLIVRHIEPDIKVHYENGVESGNEIKLQESYSFNSMGEYLKTIIERVQ